MWELNNDDLCQNIINLFEKRNDRHGQGEIGGAIKIDKKDTIDISIDIYELFNESEFSMPMQILIEGSKIEDFLKFLRFVQN